MILSQKEIYDYLCANPLGVNVNIGELEDLNGDDYIFLDFEREELIGSDNRGVYKLYFEIVCACKNFDNCITLTRYVQDKFNVDVRYNQATDFEYYLSNNNGWIILYENNEDRKLHGF